MTDHDPDRSPDDADPVDDLDGHSFDELAEYVERGRTPYDPSIEDSPGCRRAIAALEKLRRASARLATEDEGAPAGDDAWVSSVMAQVVEEARAGADFLLAATPGGDQVLMTEGALRSVVRDAGDATDGCLVGRVRFEGDLSSPPGPLTVTLRVVVVYGLPILAASTALRAAVRQSLEQHTAFRRTRIDVIVDDVVAPGASR